MYSTHYSSRNYLIKLCYDALKVNSEGSSSSLLMDIPLGNFSVFGRMSAVTGFADVLIFH